MVWHIFKKDWKLTWPMVVGVFLIIFIHRLALYKMGHFGRPALGSLLYLLLVGGYLGSAFLIASVVHQDAIPGLRQDWLVRPIRRRDLLSAKILFVLFLVQVPMITADALESLLFGFPLSQSVTAAVSRGMGLLPFFYLATLAFASLTRNLTEAVIGAVIVLLGGIGIVELAGSLSSGGHLQLWVEWSGLSWITQSERILITVLVAIAILGLQYFRRRTLPSRWVFGVGAVLWMMTFFTPWEPAFAVQKWASSSPGAASSVAITYAPDLGKAKPTVGLDPEARRIRTSESAIQVSLPLRIMGLPNDVVLKADHYEMRVVGNDGKPLQAGAEDNLEVFNEGAAPRETAAYQSVRVPANVYNHVKNELVRLEIDYSLTLMRLSGAYAIPAIGGDQRTAELGWCRTRVNDEQNAILLRCVQPGNGPNCASAFLENASTGQRNPGHHGCQPNYAPYVARMQDSINRFGGAAAFRDPTGLAHYPVDGPQLENTRLVVRVYRPEEHFTRHVIVQSIRLSDWVAR